MQFSAEILTLKPYSALVYSAVFMVLSGHFPLPQQMSHSQTAVQPIRWQGTVQWVFWSTSVSLCWYWRQRSQKERRELGRDAYRRVVYPDGGVLITGYAFFIVGFDVAFLVFQLEEEDDVTVEG